MFLTLLKLINWFLTKEPSAPIVVEPTSEKIIMETQIEPVVQIRDWAIERIRSTDDYDIALALVAEFEEWLDLEGKDEIDYLCIETNEWGDQEIDVR